MRLTFLIGGKAGQGINKISEIISAVLMSQGYYVFNYRDYPSLIRGGHNFNVVTISNEPIGSNDSKYDGIIAMDDLTLEMHKKDLKKDGFIIGHEKFENLGRNLNVAQAGALAKVLGVSKDVLVEEVKRELNFPESIAAGEKGYESEKKKYDVPKLNNKVSLMNGSQGIALGAVKGGLDVYIGYPMTPSTPAMNAVASHMKNNFNLRVFQAESELGVVNASIGASFAGACVMTGSSGGGFDLMTEGLSFAGMAEYPLLVHLCARAGPGTGVPTYTSQADLNVAVRGGHGEFPRIVVAPGDALECIRCTNEALYLANQYNCLGIVLTDKHVAESQYTFSDAMPKFFQAKVNRKVPGKTDEVVRCTSYEHDKDGFTVEDAKTTKIGMDRRLKRYEQIKKACQKFEMFKVYGNPQSKNLIISWGSCKGAILDAIKGLDVKFLQIVYVKPLPEGLKSVIDKSKNVILIEGNSTGQLGRMIREKIGLKINNRIYRYDSRPFLADELRKEISKVIK